MICIFKCPTCGDKMRFSISEQMLVCDTCQGRVDVNSYNVDDVTYEGTADLSEEMEQYECPSCGSKVITTDVNASMKCGYCGETMVSFAGRKGEIMPERIIPFKVPKRDVDDCIAKWWMKHPSLPKFNRDKLKIEKEAMYVPVWLASVDTISYMEADMEYDAHTKLVAYGSVGVSYGGECYSLLRDSDVNASPFAHKNYNANEKRVMKHRTISKKLHSEFHNVPADGSVKIADERFNGIEPYDYSEMLNFNPAYLSGHKAERYYFDQNHVMPRILRRTNQYGEELCKTYLEASAPEGETYDIIKKNITSTPTEVFYVLVPVWVCSYMHGGKRHLLYVNGQTGKTDGDIALSGVKYKSSVITYGITEMMFWSMMIFAAIGTFFFHPALSFFTAVIAIVVQYIIDVSDGNIWAKLLKNFNFNTGTQINESMQLRNGRKLNIRITYIGNIIFAFVGLAISSLFHMSPAIGTGVALGDFVISVFLGALVAALLTSIFAKSWKNYLKRQEIAQYYEYLSVTSTREIE